MRSIREMAEQSGRRLAWRAAGSALLLGLPLLLSGLLALRLHMLGATMNTIEQQVTQALQLGDQFQIQRIVGSLVSGRRADGAAVMALPDRLVIGMSGASVPLPSRELYRSANTFGWSDYHIAITRTCPLYDATQTLMGSLCLTTQVPWWPVFLLLACGALFAFAQYRSARHVLRQLAAEFVQPISRLPANLTESPSEGVRYDIAELQWLLEQVQFVRARDEEFRALQAKMQQQAALCSLSTQVAHDIRSPLSSMQVAVRGLSAGMTAGAPDNPFLTLLHMSAQRLEAIANGLLQQHQGEAERPTIFSIHAILDELIGEYQQRDDTAAITIVKQYNGRAMELHGPRTRLQRALGNIVKNAIEAMQGRGTLTLTTNQTETHAIIALQDTGPGMSSATLAKVLRGGHTKGKADGHGIGTQVVREAAELFGGQVDGDSVVGTGTTFRLVLPLPTASERASAERETLALRELRIPVHTHEPVVVVDDEPSMREQWRVLLTEQRTNVRLCTCYEDVEAQGITAAVSHTAIVDYHFANSVHTGIEVVQWLQQRGFVHLILCTAEYWKPSVQQQAQALGIQLCPKPVPERILVDVVADESLTASATTLAAVPAPEAQTTALPGEASVPRTPEDAAATKPNVLVLDDDDSIRLSWQLERERLGIGELQAFPSMEACEAATPDYAAYDFAFVDKNIPDSVWRIDQVIAHLKRCGVKQVIVATGEAARDVAHDPLCATADAIAHAKIPDSLTQVGEPHDA